jgi:hypothetical protein
MRTRALFLIPALAVASVTALATPALAGSGNGESACSQSGIIVLGSHHFIDTFGRAVVAPTVQEGDGFSGAANPGAGFDWWEGSAGDGPVVPGVCNPNG